MLEEMNELLVEADIFEPAGQGTGYSIEYDEDAMKELIKEKFKKYFEL